MQAEIPVKSSQPTICAVCAWREGCKKKYNYSQGGSVKCPDYTRDLALKDKKKETS
jgi:hypothetical protein